MLSEPELQAQLSAAQGAQRRLAGAIEDKHQELAALIAQHRAAEQAEGEILAQLETLGRENRRVTVIGSFTGDRITF